MSFQSIFQIAQDLKARWQQEGLQVDHGVMKSEFIAFKNKYKVPLPREVKDFYSVIDGSRDIDHNLFCVWPLAKIAPVSGTDEEIRRLQLDGLFKFADYSMKAHTYAFKICYGTFQTTPIFILENLQDPPPRQIAISLAEFLASYLNDPSSIE